MPIDRLPVAGHAMIPLPSRAPSAARQRQVALLATHISNMAPATHPAPSPQPAAEPAPDYPGAMRGYPQIPKPDY